MAQGGGGTLFWTFPSICYQCQSIKLPKRKFTNEFIRYVAINFLKSWDKHFLKRFFATWQVSLPQLCGDYHQKNARVGTI